MKNLTTILVILCLAVFADYTITVQNGPHALFQHPVAIELTAQQAEFVRQATLRAAADDTPLPFTLDATGPAPRLCWTLPAETAPAEIRTFHLGSASAGSVPAHSCAGDLKCTVSESHITVRNSYFQLRHPLRGKGGFPQDLRFIESGYTDSALQFFDRLFHPDRGLFWARLDRDATCRILLDTPQRVVLESRTRFVNDLGENAPGNPVAVYQYIYAPDSPVVEVRRTITRDDATLPWTEAHFLQTARHDRFYTTIHCDGQPVATAGTPSADPRFLAFSQWGIYAAPLGAYGLGRTNGTLYDRGRDGFPYNIAAPNLGLPEGVANTFQTACLYFGPDRGDDWFARWLGEQPTIDIQEETASEEPAIVSTFSLDCNGLRIHFAAPEQGCGILAVENTLDEKPVRFVFPRTAEPALWRLAFRQPHATETIWLNSSVPAHSCASESAGETVSLTWQALDLPGEPGAVDVCCEITPVPGRPEAAFRIQVTNRSTRWGLAETQFPMLTQVIQPGQGDALLPDSNWGHRLFRNSHTQCDWPYLSHKCQMQFMAFSQGDAGLYFAAHDPGARPKRLTVTTGQDASFRLYAENCAQPGTGNTADFDFCLAAYRGTWWHAAKRYRQWATTHAPWTAKGPIATRNDFPKSLVDTAFWQTLSTDTFTSTDQLGSLMEDLHARIDHRPGFAFHWYCWHQIPFDNSYPEYFPVREGFEANVRRLTSQGMLVMPYINGRLWDTEIPSFENAREAAALPENGSPAIEVYGSGRKLTPMCPYTTLWQDKMLEICTRLIDEYHVSGIYLDQISCAPAELCFNPTHGHPLGGGTHWVDGYRTLLDRIKAKAAPKGVFLTSECAAEPYMDNLDGHLIWTPRTQEEVPTLAAVYSGYTIFFSNTCSDQDTLHAYQAAQARDFLWGCQPGWNQVWIADNAHREHFAYLAQLGYLQRAAKDFFRTGELLAEQTPANAPGTVTFTWNWEFPHQVTLQAAQGYWWKAPDGRLLLAIANLAPDVRSFNVANANLAQLAGLDAEGQTWLAERLTDDGTAPLRQTANLFSHNFTLEPNEIVLVTFTPATRKTLKDAQKRAKTLAFDQKVSPELRNAAAEYLFRTEYGVTVFHPDTTIQTVPGTPADFNYDIFGTPDKKCTVVLPDGQTASATRGPLHTAALQLDAADARAVLHCELRRGNLAWRLPVGRQIVSPVEVSLGDVPEIRAGSSFVLPVTITNHQRTPASGLVRLNVPERWFVEPARAIAFEHLPPDTPFATLLRIQVPTDAATGPTAIAAEVIADHLARDFQVQPQRPQMTAYRATTPIDLQDDATWPDAPWATPQASKIADHHGNDDCAARLRCAWDDQYLYVQAEVTDDAHVQLADDEKIWSGDCIQLALRPGRPNLVAGYDGREREFGLALASDGQPLVYQWMGGLANARLDNAPVRITRDGDTTRYRAAIPWSAMLLKPPRPGEAITFSFTVNDNDSDHLRGWLEWSSGVCGGKDSSRFGELHFAE